MESGVILEEGEFISTRAVEGGLKSFLKNSTPIGIVTSSSLVKLSNFRRISLEARRNWSIDKPHLEETMVFFARRQTLLLLSQVTSFFTHFIPTMNIEEIKNPLDT